MEVKVKELNYAEEFTMEEAIAKLLSVDPYSGGELECMRYKLDNIEKLLIAVVARNATVDTLNDFATYRRWEEVKQGEVK